MRLHLDDHCSFLSAAFPAVKRRYFHSKSGLSTNGIVCLACFKLQHSPMYNSVLGEKMAMFFLEQTTIGAGVHALSTIFFACRKSTNSCFEEFTRLPSLNVDLLH